MIRSFLAIKIPGSVCEDLGGIQEKLRESNADVKWVKPANIHLTLRFFGDIHPEDIDGIRTVVSNVAIKEKALTLRAEGVGVFPTIRSPRVIWVGLSGEADRLSDIQIRIEGELETIGFKGETRTFSPHLTIGRLKSRANKALIEGLGKLKGYRSEPFEAREVILFRSDLRPNGPIYTPLEVIPLGGKS
jgi:2'-5' RNA ligase